MPLELVCCQKDGTDLWTCVRCLNFIFRQSSFGTVNKFVSFVDKCLILNRSSKIIKFLLDFQKYDDKTHLHSKILDIWICYVTRVHVEELSIGLYEDSYVLGTSSVNDDALVRNYTLPKDLFSCSSLTKLYMSHCNVALHGVITWTLLKSLSIRRTRLSDEVIQKIVSGSPALEFMEICDCSGLNRLEITSASLRKVVIKDYWVSKEVDTSLEIFAPNSLSLDVLGSIATKCTLVDVSSLVSANMAFQMDKGMFKDDNAKFDKYYKESRDLLRQLLNDLRHVKELTLGFWRFQVRSLAAFCFLLYNLLIAIELFILHFIQSLKTFDLFHTNFSFGFLVIIMPCPVSF